jgi:hypothetical protein
MGYKRGIQKGDPKEDPKGGSKRGSKKVNDAKKENHCGMGKYVVHRDVLGHVTNRDVLLLATLRYMD